MVVDALIAVFHIDPPLVLRFLRVLRFYRIKIYVF